jgi:hypothetical protein
METLLTVLATLFSLATIAAFYLLYLVRKEILTNQAMMSQLAEFIQNSNGLLQDVQAVVEYKKQKLGLNASEEDYE